MRKSLKSVLGLAAMAAALGASAQGMPDESRPARRMSSAYKMPLNKAQKKRRAKEKRAKTARKINWS